MKIQYMLSKEFRSARFVETGEVLAEVQEVEVPLERLTATHRAHISREYGVGYPDVLPTGKRTIADEHNLYTRPARSTIRDPLVLANLPDAVDTIVLIEQDIADAQDIRDRLVAAYEVWDARAAEQMRRNEADAAQRAQEQAQRDQQHAE